MLYGTIKIQLRNPQRPDYYTWFAYFFYPGELHDNYEIILDDRQVVEAVRGTNGTDLRDPDATSTQIVNHLLGNHFLRQVYAKARVVNCDIVRTDTLTTWAYLIEFEPKD